MGQRFFSNIFTKLYMNAFTLSFVIALIVAYKIMGSCNYYFDTLTITATGERNELSLAEEVFINQIVANGKVVDITPIEGKWFWQGDLYLWRIETDDRQPEGTTRQVSFSIPVGKINQRSISFQQNKWSGLVQIAVKGNDSTLSENKIIDNYLGIIGNYSYPLPASSKQILQKEFICDCFSGVGAFIIVFSFCYSLFTLFKKKVPITKHIKAHKSVVIIAIMAIFHFFIISSASAQCGLWLDEVYQLDAASQQNVLKVWSTVGGTNLLGILLHFWIKIVPDNIRWLLILPELFMSLGVFAIGITVKESFGSKYGIIATLIASTNYFVMLLGNNIRPYPLLFLGLILSINTYFIRMKNRRNETPKQLIIFGLCLTLTAYSHVLCVFSFAVFFIVDLVLYLKKEISGKFIVSYGICGGLFLIPYLFTLIFIRRGVLESWAFQQYDPVIADIWAMLSNITDNKVSVIMLLSVGLVFGIVNCFRINKTNFDKLFPSTTCTLVVIVYFIVMLNIKGFWIDRYVFSILPFVIIISVNSIYEFTQFLLALFGKSNVENYRKKSSSVVLCICMALYLFSNLQNLQELKYNSADYYSNGRLDNAANYVYNFADIYLDSTAIVLNTTLPINRDIVIKYCKGYSKFVDSSPLLTETEFYARIDEFSRVYYIYVIDQYDLSFLRKNKNEFALDESVKNGYVIALDRIAPKD